MIEVKGVMIDKKWKWIAKDADGTVCVYTKVPTIVDDESEWSATEGGCSSIKMYPLVMETMPWNQSLHEIQHTDGGLILMPWRPGFIVDDPVMVRNCEKCSWVGRHFAKWGLRGELLTWENGTTSFTSQHGFTAKWNYYRLPTPEELNRNANHK